MKHEKVLKIEFFKWVLVTQQRAISLGIYDQLQVIFSFEFYILEYATKSLGNIVIARGPDDTK